MIARQSIKKAEGSIRLFVFGEYSKSKVKIIEKYILSAQYDLAKLYRVYKESMLEEMRDSSYVIYTLVKGGKIDIQDNVFNIEIEEGTMSKLKKGEIEKYINRLFINRFGMSVNTVVKLIRVQNETEQEEEVEESFEEESYTRNEFQERQRELEEKMVQSYDAESNEVLITADMVQKKAPSEPSKKKDYKATADDYRKKNYNDVDCFYGKNVEADIVPVSSIVEELPNFVAVRGQIFGMETRPIKNEKTILKGYITDFTDTIGFKLFVNNDDLDLIMEDMKENSFVIMKGVPEKDSWSKELMLSKIDGVKKTVDFREKRKDTAEEKRVELHLHTRFSEMDAVTSVEAAVGRAIDWGHKAIAITDHGVVHGFTEANKYLKSRKDAPEDFKILYGVEGYFVDDIKTLVMNSHGQSLESDYAGNVLDRFSEFVNPEEPIPYSIEKLTSINDNMVKDADTIDKVLPRFFKFCEGAMLVAHNATFDTTFIRVNAKRLGMEYNFTALDTMTLAYIFLPELGRYTLDRLTNYFKLTNAHHHRAVDDAEVTSEIFVKLMHMINESGAETVDDLNKLGSASADTIKKAKSYHGILFYTNETGRTNLYRLISEAHIKYFNKKPRIPMSLIEKYREGLIVGSACASGMLFSAILDGAEDEEIERLVRFFDYLEIQPIGNNRYLIDDEKTEIRASAKDGN